MESLPFPRRLGPAPSATAALAAELVRPLADGLLKSPKPLMKKQAVKRHHHKHNLRHRYEFLETLGKGTYGKVKKARETSGRLVSAAPSAAPAGGLRCGCQEWSCSQRSREGKGGHSERWRWHEVSGCFRLFGEKELSPRLPGVIFLRALFSLSELLFCL